MGNKIELTIPKLYCQNLNSVKELTVISHMLLGHSLRAFSVFFRSLFLFPSDITCYILCTWGMLSRNYFRGNRRLCWLFWHKWWNGRQAILLYLPTEKKQQLMGEVWYDFVINICYKLLVYDFIKYIMRSWYFIIDEGKPFV